MEKMKTRVEDKIILDLCGGTGAWSKYYTENNYDVRIITLPENDVRFYIPPKNVYGILAAPPCTMFSFARTRAKQPRNLKDAMEIVSSCLNIIWECQYQTKTDTSKKTKLKFWAIENPNGMLKFFLGKSAFEFNPYDFGDNYKKLTQLWGWFNTPHKQPVECNMSKFDQLKTRDIHGEYYGKLNRQERRGITPSGFAKAFYEVNK